MKPLHHPRRLTLGMALLLAQLPAVYADDPVKCTLERSEGSEEMVLSNKVHARFTWSSCTSLGKELGFEWPQMQKENLSPQAALDRAAQLVSEWEAAAKTTLGPWDSVSKALAQRARQPKPYAFGEDIAVTDNQMPGWDGVSIEQNPSGRNFKLTVRYWANP